MSALVQTGQAGPFQMDDELEWDERNGWRRVIVWHGTEVEIAGLIPTYAVAGYQLSRRKAPGGLFQLRVSANNAMDGSPTTTDAAITVDWELDGSDFEISIYKRMAQRSVPTALVNAIEAGVNQVRDGTFTRDIILNASVTGILAVATAEGFNTTTATEWFDLVLEGVEAHRVSNYVVRKTIAAPNAWVAGATLNVGKLYTKTQLLAEHTGVHAVPNGISADMPSTGYYLKGTTRRRTMGNGKIQIVMEWQHGDAFSALQYDLVT